MAKNSFVIMIIYILGNGTATNPWFYTALLDGSPAVFAWPGLRLRKVVTWQRKRPNNTSSGNALCTLRRHVSL